MEPEGQSLDLHQHPNQNTHKTANVELDCQSMDLRRHPSQTHNQITGKHTQKRKRLPGVVSHDHLPTYLVWNKDQGDVVPPKGKENLARNRGKTHYQGAGLEPSVVMHRYPKFSFLSYLHKQTTPIQERSKHTSIQNNSSIHQMRTSISNRYPHSTHYNQTSGSHNRFDCLSKSSVRAVFALNLAITRLR